MTFTVNTKVYAEDSTINKDAIRYAGPLQTGSVVDNFELKRVAPKRTATYEGNSRGGIRLTRSAVVNGKTLVAFVDSNTSIPVGFPSADATALVNDASSLMGSATGHAVIEGFKVKF